MSVVCEHRDSRSEYETGPSLRNLGPRRSRGPSLLHVCPFTNLCLEQVGEHHLRCSIRCTAPITSSPVLPRQSLTGHSLRFPRAGTDYPQVCQPPRAYARLGWDALKKTTQCMRVWWRADTCMRTRRTRSGKTHVPWWGKERDPVWTVARTKTGFSNEGLERRGEPSPSRNTKEEQRWIWRCCRNVTVLCLVLRTGLRLGTGVLIHGPRAALILPPGHWVHFPGYPPKQGSPSLSLPGSG